MRSSASCCRIPCSAPEEKFMHAQSNLATSECRDLPPAARENSKSEARNPKQTSSTTDQNNPTPARVSDFGFRASDFPAQRERGGTLRPPTWYDSGKQVLDRVLGLALLVLSVPLILLTGLVIR